MTKVQFVKCQVAGVVNFAIISAKEDFPIFLAQCVDETCNASQLRKLSLLKTLRPSSPALTLQRIF